MRIPLVYNVRSVMQRPLSTALTAFGIALVVAVFVAMLALAGGFRVALARTGSDGNVLVLRRGGDSELTSGISRESARIISSFPQVASGRDGQPLASAETYVVINIAKADDTSAVHNVVARGVSEQAFTVRTSITMVEGRRFESGRNEVIIGKKIVGRFANTAVGDTLRFAGRAWAVVGHFTAGGGAFESEVWGENEQFMPVFRGQVFQSVTFRLAQGAEFQETKRALESDQRIQVTAFRERAFYSNQSEMLGRILQFLAVVITGIMAVGAVFGAVNTMYAAVASRGPEIAVLLTLGFRPRHVLVSFLAEAAVIAAVGGVVGGLMALPINGLVTSTTNWASFSELAFAFRVTPRLLLAGIVFGVVMGVVGGFLPARRASRLPVIEAIR